MTAARALTVIDENHLAGSRAEISGPHKSVPLWICIHFPRIALTVFSQHQGNHKVAGEEPRKPWQDNMPRVVFEETRGRQVVYTACDLALGQGIMPGMPLNAAYVLCQGLRVELRDRRVERRRLKQLAMKINAITPDVSLASPDCILLEVSGSLKLFGGFQQVSRRVREAYAGEPLISSAPSPAAALLLARNGVEVFIHSRNALKSALGEIAIGNSEIPAKVARQLSKCGLKTLRDLWRLPRPDLARRFGVELLDYLDRACGESADSRKRLRPVTRFFQRIDLPAETEDSKLILLAMESLLERAADFLRMRGSAAEKLVFKLWYSNRAAAGAAGNRAVLVVRSRQADRQPRRFFPQVCEQLDGLDIAAPVTGVSLRIDQVLQYQCATTSLFDHGTSRGNNHGEDWDQLLDVLSSRLGREMVYGVFVVPDHRPEYSWHRVTLPHDRDSGDFREISAGPSRPLWLLPVPRKIPASRLRLAGEVERIESGWWDGKDIRRDYCEAQTSSGSRYWIYRDLAGKEDVRGR